MVPDVREVALTRPYREQSTLESINRKTSTEIDQDNDSYRGIAANSLNWNTALGNKFQIVVSF